MAKSYPKRAIRTFRDLDVYQQTLAASVTVTKKIKGKLARHRYPMLNNMINCSLSIPLFISEAHSLRFGDYPQAMRLLEQAMADCNKMVVYLDQIRGLYGDNIDFDLLEEQIKLYTNVRRKIFHLFKSWEKSQQVYTALNK